MDYNAPHRPNTPTAPVGTATLSRAHRSARRPTGLSLAHRAGEDGDGMTEREVWSFHGEAGSPTP